MVTLAVAAPGAAHAASPDDQASIERGRTAGREMLMLRDPRVFGIALLHARSQADVDAFLAGRGDRDFAGVPAIGASPASGLRAFVNDGDRVGFDAALQRFDDLFATAAMWSGDPRGAALFDAGVVDVVIAGAGGTAAQERLSANAVVDLVKHAGRIPDGTLGLDLAPIRNGVPIRNDAPIRTDAPISNDGKAQANPMQSPATAFARDLAAAIDASSPPAPFATPRFADGPAGDAALGVAGSTVAELIDCPLWLMQADSQRFIDTFVARLVALAPASRARIDELRTRLRGGPEFARGPAAHDAAIKASTELMVSVMQSDKARTKPILLGSVAAQLVYNAAILRDSSISGALLRAIASTPALDASVPGWAEARTGANTIGPADWTAQYHFGLQLVDLIMKGGSR